MTAASSGPRSRPVSASRTALQVAADRLQLAHDAPSRRGRPRRARGTASSVSGASTSDRLGLEHVLRVLARLDAGRARRAARGADRRRHADARRKLLVASARRARRSRAASEPRRGRGARRGAAGRAPRGTRARPRRDAGLAQVGERRGAVPLRELLPVLAEQRARGGCTPAASPPSAAMQRGLHLGVRPVVGAADHVRDPEVEVVDRRSRADTSACRRARSSVSCPNRSAPSASGSPIWCAPRGGARSARSGAPAPRPRRRRATRDRRRSPPPRPRRSARRPCRRSAAGTTPPCSSAKRRFATALSAPPRCSEPVGLGAKRTRTMRARYTGACDGSRRGRTSPGAV